MITHLRVCNDGRNGTEQVVRVAGTRAEFTLSPAEQCVITATGSMTIPIFTVIASPEGLQVRCDGQETVEVGPPQPYQSPPPAAPGAASGPGSPSGPHPFPLSGPRSVLGPPIPTAGCVRLWQKLAACWRAPLFDPEVRSRLFAGYPYLGLFFSCHPVALAAALALAGLIGLCLLAWLLGIHSFPSNPPRLLGNGGIFYSGWPLNFVLGLPVIFALLAWLSRAMVRRVAELVDGPQQVIEAESGAIPFWDALSGKLRAAHRPLLGTVAALVGICTLLDNGDLWLGYFTGSFKRDRLEAWDAAAYNPEIHLDRPISKFWSAVFNIISLLGFQGAAIFLGFFFAFYFWLFFYYFSQLLFQAPSYRFRPVWHDLDKRLGLRPLGLVFNLFMTAAILYEIGVFLKRIELSINNGQSEPLAVWLGRILTSSTSAEAFSAVFSLERYQFNTLDKGAYIALFAMLIPICIACYFPVSLYRNIIAGQKARTTSDMRAYDNLLLVGRTAEAKQLKRLIMAAREANCWPNGTATALGIFAVMGLLLVATWFPPVVAYGVTAGALVFVAKVLWPKASA